MAPNENIAARAANTPAVGATNPSAAIAVPDSELPISRPLLMFAKEGVMFAIICAKSRCLNICDVIIMEVFFLLFIIMYT